MSDSLDMLLTRAPSAAARRPSAVTTSAAYSANARQPSAYQDYTPTSASYRSGNSQQQPTTPSRAPPSSGYTSYDRPPSMPYEAKSPAPHSGYDRASSLTSPSAASSGGSALGASLVSSLTAKLASAEGPVNWSALKARRQGSASATSTTSDTTKNSAAAGLADAYAKSATSAVQPAVQSKESTDDTVISGSMVFPARPGAPAKLVEPTTPIKRTNPFATPVSSPVSASPFATATSTMSRPAPIGSPAGSPGAPMERAVQTYSCPDCRRNFKRGSLMKHQKVCKKVFATKRGPFDASKARTQDLGIVAGPYEDASDEEDDDDDAPRGSPSKPAAKANEEKEQLDAKSWKDQSESLREAMRRAKKNKGFASSAGMGIDMRAMMPKQQH